MVIMLVLFRCLHGQWYRGQLVTANYLRLERYQRRFQDPKASSVILFHRAFLKVYYRSPM